MIGTQFWVIFGVLLVIALIFWLGNRERSMTVCPQCGTTRESQFPVCPSCGHHVEDSA